jgi:hypothetical protein
MHNGRGAFMDVVDKLRGSPVVKRRIPAEIINIEDLFRVHIVVEAVLSPKIPNPRQGAYPGPGEDHEVAGCCDAFKEFWNLKFCVHGFALLSGTTDAQVWKSLTISGKRRGIPG